MTKAQAIQGLRQAGFPQVAAVLDGYRDVNGNNWGWDGWIRGHFPGVVATVFPGW
jgi:hypothetical protein